MIISSLGDMDNTLSYYKLQ